MEQLVAAAAITIAAAAAAPGSGLQRALIGALAGLAWLLSEGA